ncbi:MAG: CDGSH iron-sulfur domain-containing protein [Bacteroidales bacterium]|jgi:CDGSH-type Zn-finger protein|nr:CDGSH iron-sulfur domain-containing protein [Bacteroidales bacterium]
MFPQKTIQILKNGPYLVSADIPLKKVKINPLEPVHLKDFDTMPFVHAGYYALCRCGQSQNAPFCDGAHVKAHFDGTETADKTPYLNRADVFEGEAMQLLDDDRCAFARFCHRQHGSVWDLMDQDDVKYKQEIVEGASLCPTGRLTAMDAEHGLHENTYEPQILIAEDPHKGVSAGLFVQGGITLIGADGVKYEVRNRMALCRCGKSQNKPFCDAAHVPHGYKAHYTEE